VIEQLDTRTAATTRRWLLSALVFVLPLHTLFVRAWVAWKPFLWLLVALAAWDVLDGIRRRSWPWHRQASIAAGIFLVVMAVSWLGGIPDAQSLRLWLALGAGALLLLVVERAVRVDGAEGGLVHWIGGCDPADITIGMRVRAVFEEDRTGGMTDIRHFEPL